MTPPPQRIPIFRGGSIRKLVAYPLWIGHAGDARDFLGLEDRGIRALVQLAREEAVVPGPRDLLWFRIPLDDGAGNDPQAVMMAVRTVAELIAREVPTLVCCGAGMSRSPVIASSALAIVSGKSFRTCLESVLDSGSCDVAPGLLADVVELLGFSTGQYPG